MGKKVFSKKLMFLLMVSICISNVSYAFENGVDESKKYSKIDFKDDKYIYVNKDLDIKKDFLSDTLLESKHGEIRINDYISNKAQNNKLKSKRKYVVRDKHSKDIFVNKKSIMSVAKGAEIVLNDPIVIKNEIKIKGEVDKNTLKIAKQFLESNYGKGISKIYSIGTKFVGPEEGSVNNSRMYYYSTVVRTGYLTIKKVGEKTDFSKKIYYEVPIKTLEWTEDLNIGRNFN